MSTNNNTSKQRKAYVVILALALGGLGVDRILLDGGATGPSQTEASLSPTPTPGVTPAPGTIPGTTTGFAPGSARASGASAGSPTARTMTLAGRLDKIAESESFDLAQVEDAFLPASGWLKKEQPKARPVVKVDEVQAFTNTHKLLALVNNAHGGAAIINNQTVVLGKVVDGFTLIEVTKRSAIFEKDGRRVELSLPAPAGSLTKAGD